MFVKSASRRDAVVADPTQFLFFNRAESFRVAHPVPGGDDSTVLNLEESALFEFLRRNDPSSTVSPSHPFTVAGASSSNGMVLGVHRLRQRLEQREHMRGSLPVEEAAVQLLGEAVQIASPDSHNSPGRSVREDTRREHDRLVRATRVFLSRQLRENVNLAGIARAVFSSPFHLARVFRRHTGMSLHMYLVKLRLREALNHLADGTSNLTGLALELGFSSHSHFTGAFRRHFGASPSHIRRQLSSGLLRRLSRNLEA